MKTNFCTCFRGWEEKPCRNPANWKFTQSVWPKRAFSFFAIDKTTTSHL